MPLILDSDTVRIDLSTPGEWVEVKARLSKGDTVKLESAAFALRAKFAVDAAGAVPGADVNADLDYEATVFRGLEIGIQRWSFDLPLTPENIRKLDPVDYDIIAKRVNELWSPRKEEDRKNLSDSGATPTEARVLSLPNSNGS